MYDPIFRITPYLVRLIEEAGNLRFWIENAPLKVAWLPMLQHEARVRAAHSSTAIEGNPLSLAQVNAIAKGQEVGAPKKNELDVINYISAMRWIEKHAKKRIDEKALLKIHKLLTSGLLPEERTGRYKEKQNYIVDEKGIRVFTPPPPGKTPVLVRELLRWLNSPRAGELPPIMTCAIFHHRLVSIHPFSDGNGRLARAIGTAILYQRGFDAYHIFSLDDFFAGDRKRYYEKLQQARELDDDLTCWIEYAAEGVVRTLKDVRRRIEGLQVSAKHKILLTSGQEELIRVLRLRQAASSSDLRKHFKVSRARINQIIAPLIKTGLVLKTGQGRSTRYLLKL